MKRKILLGLNILLLLGFIICLFWDMYIFTVTMNLVVLIRSIIQIIIFIYAIHTTIQDIDRLL